MEGASTTTANLRGAIRSRWPSRLRIKYPPRFVPPPGGGHRPPPPPSAARFDRDGPRDRQLDFRSRPGFAADGEFRADPLRALEHPPQAEVPGFAAVAQHPLI